MLIACVLDFEGSWDVHLPLVEFSYNNSYNSSVRCAPFEALYGRKCRSPIIWAKFGEGQLIGPKLVQETTKKISYIKDRLKVVCDRQKSYANKRMKLLKFSVGDYVLLKVSPWKGVVHFGKKGKLAPRFVGPFEITKRIGPVAYRLRLPEELNGVHDTLYVSNLKKCLAYPTLQVPLDEIQVDAKLNFIEEPMEILERELKKLKRGRIAIVKAKHEEAASSYADLKWEVEDFHETTFRAASNTDVHLRNFKQILTRDKGQHVEGINMILTNLQEVQNAVKEDPTLNKKVLDAAEAYTKNFSNLIELLTLVKDLDFSSIKSTIESLHAVVIA
ncbi:putative reverse transcriptase domain-containing protein [Tanacetum coccineum]